MTTAAEQLEMEEDLFGDTADSPLEIARAQLAICARKLAAAEKKIRRLQGRVFTREDSIQKEIAKRKEEKKAHKKVVAVLQDKITLSVNVLTAHHVALQEIGP